MDTSKRGQRPYREALMNALLHTPPPPPPPPLSPLPQSHLTHYWQPFEKRGYCIWCKRYRERLVPMRHPLAEVGNPGANRANTTPIASSQAVSAQAVTAQSVSTQSASAQAVSAPIERKSKVCGGCRIYSAYLCVKGSCFSLYHSHRSRR